MTRCFLSILLLSCFCVAGAQQAGQFLITGIQFHSDAEKEIFDAIENKQPFSPVQLFMVIDSTATEQSILTVEESINDFVLHLKDTRPGKSFSKTIQNYFDETHQKFFTKYQLTVFFNEIFENGNFNCVTASALYSILFEKLGIDYAIKEMPTHVYLIVNPGKENINVETTNPDGRTIAISDDFKKSYVNFLKAGKILSEKDVATASTDDLFYKSYYPDSDISLVQLAGVQYYNKGIELLRNQEFGKAITAFEKSYKLYPVKRTSFLIISCLESILNNDLIHNYDQNKEYLVKYINYTHMEQTRQNLKTYYEKIADELLLNQNDKAHYESLYYYLRKNITDSAALVEIDFTHYYYMGTAEALKSNLYKALAYLRHASEINSNNLVLQSIVSDVVVHLISEKDEDEAGKLLDSLKFYSELFPFLEENHKIQMVYPFLFLQLAGNSYNLNKGEAGGKFISSFETYYQKHPDAELNEEAIAWGYSEASSYYVRKGNKTKAKEMLETGLRYSPGNERLKTKMSYLKYF